MAWIKNNLFVSIITFLLVFMVVADADARRNRKSVDAMWSVSNTSKKEIVPSYTGGKSPFPIITAEEAKKRLKTKGYKKKGARRKKVILRGGSKTSKTTADVRIAEIMTKIHAIIVEKQAYNPDIEAVKIEGFINSTFGAKILLYNRWFSVGDNVSVTMIQTDDLNKLIKQLKELDDNLAQIVMVDMQDKMTDKVTSRLILTKISKTSVEVRDSFGEKHVISFVINSL